MNIKADCLLRVLGQLARDLGVDVPIRLTVVESGGDECFKIISRLVRTFQFSASVSHTNKLASAESVFGANHVDVCVTTLACASDTNWESFWNQVHELKVPTIAVSCRGECTADCPLKAQYTREFEQAVFQAARTPEERQFLIL